MNIHKMQNRQKLAVSLLKHKFKNVLDLGCGAKLLKQYLPQNVQYQGIDFQEAEEVMPHDLENGIPFEDKSFDVVFALDALEHLENIHFVFEEMLRVARNEIVIALPNMNYWKYRLQHLLGRKLLEKYTFYPERHKDRHRWFPTHNASIEFIKFNAKNRKVDLAYGIYPRKKFKFLRGCVDTFMSNFFPELFVCTDFFHIDLINKDI